MIRCRREDHFVMKYDKLNKEILSALGYTKWNIVPYYDDSIVVKSRQSLDKYDIVRYFKDDRDNFEKVEKRLEYKESVGVKLVRFLEQNEFIERTFYSKISGIIESEVANANAFRVDVSYISSAVNLLGRKKLEIT